MLRKVYNLIMTQKAPWLTVEKSLIILTLGLGIFAFLGTAAIFWSVFLAFLFFRWDNRILGAVAILLLTSCPILLSIDQDAIAEEMAVYAYYFLVMTVALQIIELKRKPKHSNILKNVRKPEKPIPVLDLRNVTEEKI